MLDLTIEFTQAAQGAGILPSVPVVISATGTGVGSTGIIR